VPPCVIRWVAGIAANERWVGGGGLQSRTFGTKYQSSHKPVRPRRLLHPAVPAFRVGDLASGLSPSAVCPSAGWADGQVHLSGWAVSRWMSD
jgi:hypothetical protein